MMRYSKDMRTVYYLLIMTKITNLNKADPQNIVRSKYSTARVEIFLNFFLEIREKV